MIEKRTRKRRSAGLVLSRLLLILSIALSLAILEAGAWLMPSAQAAHLLRPLQTTFTADCTGGVGDVSDLIADITAANDEVTNPGLDTINLGSGCTYTLTAVDNPTYGPNGLPEITSAITIQGNSATLTRDGGAPDFRFFFVETTGALDLQNLTLSNGKAQGGAGGKGSGGGGGGGMGGAIFSLGAVVVTECTLSNNVASGGNGGDGWYGGGGPGGGGMGGNGADRNNDAGGGGGGFSGAGGKSGQSSSAPETGSEYGGGGGGYDGDIWQGEGVGANGNATGGKGGDGSPTAGNRLGADGGLGGGGGGGGAYEDNDNIYGGNGGNGGIGGGGGGGGYYNDGGDGGFGGGGGGGGHNPGGDGGDGGFGGGGGGSGYRSSGSNVPGVGGFGGGNGAVYRDTGSGGGGGAGFGGSIFNNNGTVIINKSTFSGNSANGGSGGNGMTDEGMGGVGGNGAEGGDGDGGAVFNYLGIVTIANSTFSGNSGLGGNGGNAGCRTEGGTCGVNGSGGNGQGGVIFNYNGSATLINNTIDTNTITGGSAGTGGSGGSSGTANGGGVYNYQDSGTATLTLAGVILANTSSSQTDCYNSGGSVMAPSANRNLIENHSSCDTPFLTSDPQLGALADNGGATQTMALQSDSPAIDAANETYCPVEDQRGETREDLQCDIGAFELKYTDSSSVNRPVDSTQVTTFGPALMGIQRDLGYADPGVITVNKLGWSDQGIESIDARWTIAPTNPSGIYLTLQLCYTASELGSLDENDLRFWRSNGAAWTQVGGVPTLTTVNGVQCATLSGITELSTWTLATSTPTAITLQDGFNARTRDLTGLGVAFTFAILVSAGWFMWRRKQFV